MGPRQFNTEVHLSVVERDAKLALVEQMRLEDVLAACWTSPKPFLAEINAFDPVSMEAFKFSMYPEGEDPFWPYAETRCDPGWLWQADIIDWWLDPTKFKFLILKARQLGITWLAMAKALWHLLFEPGSRCVAYSYEEEEAKKLVQRSWLMYKSLPAALRAHVEVITPRSTDLPSEWIRLKHRNGMISSLQALPATKRHGHGETIRWGVMDEAARMEYAKEIYTAINPATSRGGKLCLISTANGVSNRETGEGNYFHWLYHTREEKKLEFKFLPWNLEPTRDEAWYEKEAMVLDEVERNQQYPLNKEDAFMLSGHLFFNRDALQWYRSQVVPARWRGRFVKFGLRSGKFSYHRDGIIHIWEKPRQGAQYAISCDPSSGKAADYTFCHVIDLDSGAVVAEMRGKLEAPSSSEQLQFLGRYYNLAKIAIERQGAYGDAIIIFLRDGSTGFAPYPNLYRHRRFIDANRPLSEQYGFPMGEQNRAQILDGLKSAIRERLFPFMSENTMDEIGTFVYAETKPSPRAQVGCNDDAVMSLAIAVEVYRQFGNAPAVAAKNARRKNTEYEPSPAKAGVRS